MSDDNLQHGDGGLTWDADDENAWKSGEETGGLFIWQPKTPVPLKPIKRSRRERREIRKAWRRQLIFESGPWSTFQNGKRRYHLLRGLKWWFKRFFE